MSDFKVEEKIITEQLINSPELFFSSSRKFDEFKKYFSQKFEEGEFSHVEEFLNLSKGFHAELVKIDFLYRKGKVKDSKKLLSSILKKYFDRKAIPRVENIFDYFSENKILIPNRNLLDQKLGHTSKLLSYNSELGLDFNELKTNPDRFLIFSEVIDQICEHIELYRAVDVIELMLKGSSNINFDKVFFKTIERMTYLLGSKKVAKALVNLVEKEGRSFGMNIDRLKTVKRPAKIEKEESDYSLRLPVSIPTDKKLVVDENMSMYEQACLYIHNKDYILALALLRENFNHQKLDRNLYLNTLSKMAVCYRELNMKAISFRLESLIKLRDPKFKMSEV